MRTLRKNRWLFGWVAGLAIAFNAAAGALCCTPNAYGNDRQIYDSVLGWVSLCLPSKLAGGPAAGSGHSGNQTAHDSCAKMCAAATAFAVVYIASILGTLGPSQSDRRLVMARLRVVHAPPCRGRLGSRAPPHNV